MEIAILGYGEQGKSSYEFYNQPGNNITICDKLQPADYPDGVNTQIGDGYLDNLDRFELIVRSPGIHPRDIVQANSQQILAKVTSNTNEFFRLCPTKNIIGVTGTKGKGTTSTIIYQMLAQDDSLVHLGGNIGIPPLDLLREDIGGNDWVILELANYQLIDLKYSPHIAVCLMVEPEHLDWHTDVNEYYASKTNLFKYQKPDDLAIYYAVNDNSLRIASSGAAKKIPYFDHPGAIVDNEVISIDGQPIIRLSELKLLGAHNYQNVCAAITTVWQVKPDAVAMAQVLREFSGLPFRIEFRQKVNDVSYYNDSFASAPPATIAAIEAVQGPKVLIVGGKDRGLDLNKLALEIKNNHQDMRKVILIGESKARLAEALDKVGFNNYLVNDAKNISDIVKTASELAQPGDSVILSPGFPSFDMFSNFEDRGLKFNQAVSSL